MAHPLGIRHGPREASGVSRLIKVDAGGRNQKEDPPSGGCFSLLETLRRWGACYPADKARSSGGVLAKWERRAERAFSVRDRQQETMRFKQCATVQARPKCHQKDKEQPDFLILRRERPGRAPHQRSSRDSVEAVDSPLLPRESRLSRPRSTYHCSNRLRSSLRTTRSGLCANRRPLRVQFYAEEPLPVTFWSRLCHPNPRHQNSRCRIG